MIDGKWIRIILIAGLMLTFLLAVSCSKSQKENSAANNGTSSYNSTDAAGSINTDAAGVVNTYGVDAQGVKRYARDQLEKVNPTVAGRLESTPPLIDFKLEGKQRTAKVVFNDQKAILPRGSVVKAGYLYKPFDGQRIVATEKYFEDEKIIQKVIGEIEAGSVYELPFNDVVLSSTAVFIEYSGGSRLEFWMDITGRRFAIRGGHYSELNLSVNGKARLYCVTSPQTAVFLKELTGWEPFDISKLSSVNKMLFMDDNEVVELSDLERIKPVIVGIKKSKVFPGSQCPYDRNINLYKDEEHVANLLVAGDGCNAACIDGVFYELDKTTTDMIHDLGNDLGLSWWDWTKSTPEKN